MCNLKVGRYKHPDKVGWQGWIEPEDKTWIAFVRLDGTPKFFLDRDPKTGAVK